MYKELADRLYKRRDDVMQGKATDQRGIPNRLESDSQDKTTNYSARRVY